jgi:hypothetical protein
MLRLYTSLNALMTAMHAMLSYDLEEKNENERNEKNENVLCDMHDFDVIKLRLKIVNKKK